MMSETRYKLHPVAAVITFVKGLKDLIFPLVIFLILGNTGGEDGGLFRFIPYVLGGLALILYLISGIIKWWKYEYWFEDGELRIEYGLIVKKKRYIPFERIQSLDYTESIFHRPFKLVKVKVETAGGGVSGEAEAELTAITLAAADQIKQEMIAAKKKRVKVVDEVEGDSLEEGVDAIQPIELESETESQTSTTRLLHKMKSKDLLILAATSGGIGIIFSGAAVVLSQFSEFIPYEAIYNEALELFRFGAMFVALLVFAVVLISFLVSVVLTYLQNYGYTVTLDDKELIIQRGLLEKKRTTIPMHRIQGIQLVENPFRQLFGYATIVLDSAGGSVLEKSETVKLVPLMKRTEAVTLLTDLFPEWDWDPEFTRAPKRTRKFYYRINLLLIAIIGAVLSYFFYPYGLLFFLLIPVSVAFDIWNHKASGIAIRDTYLAMQYRFFSRKTVWLAKKRIQAVTLSQSYFEKRADAASIHATIKSGALGSQHSLKAMERDDMQRVMNWYLPNV